MTSTKRTKAKLTNKRVALGISSSQEQAMKARLLTRVCSAAWAEAMFAEIRDKKPDGTHYVVRVFNASSYPPPADTTPMIICNVCAVPYPSYYLTSSGCCVDCLCCKRPKAQSSYGPSSFAAAMNRIRICNIRLNEHRIDY